jgi:hypothetical protein
MSSFERHNIKHLSASSLNLWRAHPAKWAMQYLGGHKEESPAFWRGLAVEDGLKAHLMGHDPMGVAMNTFEKNAMGEASDEVEDERKLVAPMVAEAIKWKPPSKLFATQVEIQYWMDGVPIPIKGYLDFVFECGAIIDSKTSKTCPSRPKADHVRQVAIYRAAKDNAPGSLLYITHTKHACLPVGDNAAAEALDGLRRDAQSLERFLSVVDDAGDALRMLPFNTDDFRVNDATRAAYQTMMGV